MAWHQIPSDDWVEANLFQTSLPVAIRVVGRGNKFVRTNGWSNFATERFGKACFVRETG